MMERGRGHDAVTVLNGHKLTCQCLILIENVIIL